jgi:integrase
MTFMKVLRDAGLADRATAHGFRSTFKDWCAEVARARDEVSEACLGHRIKDKVKAAYLRTDFFVERGLLMRRWAKACLRDCANDAPVRTGQQRANREGRESRDGQGLAK